VDIFQAAITNHSVDEWVEQEKEDVSEEEEKEKEKDEQKTPPEPILSNSAYEALNYNKFSHLAKHIFPLRNCSFSFLERPVPCPRNVPKVLSNHFGHDWRYVPWEYRHETFFDSGDYQLDIA